MKCYIINLENDKIRKSNMEKQMHNSNIKLDIEWVKALDGKKFLNNNFVNFDLDRYNKNNLWNIKKTEIACTLSHRKCYSLLSKSNNENALILEDDVHINDLSLLNNPDFIKILEKEKPIIVLLSGWFWYSSVVKQINNLNICKIIDARLAHSYIINRLAANKILSEKPWYKADYWGCFKLLGIEILGLSPHLIDIEKEIARKSSINNGEKGVYNFTIKKWFFSKKDGIKRKIAKSLGHYEIPFNSTKLY